MSEALLEVERLAFVPSGSIDYSVDARWRDLAGKASAFMPPEAFDSTGALISKGPLGPSVALLVDMYETTREQWLRFEAAQSEPPAAEFVALRGAWDESTGKSPATYMTQVEASRFAQSRGMRLLSSGEWLYCAMGREARPYPWGSYGQASIANMYELGLERPAPVGTFEAGRTPQGMADMLGNVAEWVADRQPAEGTVPGDLRVSALGGSFRSHTRPLFDVKPSGGESELLAQTLAPDTRADDIGMRCCAPAADYLWSHANSWGTSAATHARLVALGRRWGRRALPVLEALATKPDAPSALDALAQGARQ